MKIKESLFWILVFAFVLNACNSNPPAKTSVVEDDMLIEEDEHIASRDVNYRIPTPLDMFVLIKSSGAPFIEESLNSPLNKVKYNSTVSRSVNFGVYITDLAYCSVYGNFQGSLIYFNAAKEISVDLGMYEGYGEEIAIRINNNLNNIDSLIDISTDSFYQTTNFLSEQGMSDILAMIMVGCWIESSYMAIESVDKFSTNSPVVERIADQRFLLENLIELCKLNANSDAMQTVLIELLDLQEVFDNLYFNSEDILITKSQYVDIANKIRELRQNFVG